MGEAEAEEEALATSQGEGHPTGGASGAAEEASGDTEGSGMVGMTLYEPSILHLAHWTHTQWREAAYRCVA